MLVSSTSDRDLHPLKPVSAVCRNKNIRGGGGGGGGYLHVYACICRSCFRTVTLTQSKISVLGVYVKLIIHVVSDYNCSIFKMPLNLLKTG